MKHLTLFLLLLSFLLSTEAYRILCLFPFNGRSHFVMFEALCKGLARKGHRIDMISHFPLRTNWPNYTDIISLNGTRNNLVNSFTLDYATTLNNAITYSLATTFGGELCDLMGNEKMQEFIRNPPKDPPYDLVVTEYCGSVCYIGFGHLLKVPVAVATSALDTAYLDASVGNPLSDSFFPGTFIPGASVEDFWDRLTNAVQNFVQTTLFHIYTSPQTDVTRKYLGEDVPDVRQLEKSISLALVNTHYSFHGVRPLTAALVEVGGIHLEMDESELTLELEKWLDDAEHGVVYFTLGSLVNIETMPASTLLGLYASFSRISPVKVLMKIARDERLPPGLPHNVKTLPWMPQIPVLRHRNTRAFITHGGLMGSQEALHYGVPVIGIPLFADQIKNVNIFVKKGMGVLVNYNDLCQRTMDAALDAVLKDPIYVKSAKRESARFRDRPMSPMDTAIYHIEYVIRNGPDALRSPATKMPWWKLQLLDIYVFFMVCAALSIYAIVKLGKVLWKRFAGCHVGEVKSKEKRN